MAYPQLTSEPGALATAALIRAGKMSAVEALDAAIERIERDDAEIDALDDPSLHTYLERGAAAFAAIPALGVPSVAVIHKAALGGGLDYFLETVFNYPTLAESYKVAALDVTNKLHALPTMEHFLQIYL